MFPIRFPISATEGLEADREVSIPMKLRERDIAFLVLPPGKSDAIFFDDDVPGFGVRLRSRGRASFIFQYRLGRKQRRVTFGRVQAMTVAAARLQAEKLHAQIKLGGDPAAQKNAAVKLANETVAHTLPIFLARQKERLRPRTYVEVERHLMVHAKRLHGLPLAKVSRRDVAAVLATIASLKSDSTANRNRSSLSSFFTWCIREGLLNEHPVAFTERREEKSRDRVLADEELRSIWNALKNDAYGNIVRLLLLTGARREEIGALSWDEIDFDQAVIDLPGERTKNGRPHVIPLTDAALAILKAQPRFTSPDGTRCGFVFGRGSRGFNDWAGAKIDLDKRIAEARQFAKLPPLAAWTLHDARRYLSTAMHERLSVQPHLVEACLGHIGHRRGIAGVYNRADYIDERRIALEKWAAHVDAVVTGKRPTMIGRLRRA